MATIASAIIILFVGAYIQVYCAFHPDGGEIFRAGEQIELRWEAEVFADEPDPLNITRNILQVQSNEFFYLPPEQKNNVQSNILRWDLGYGYWKYRITRLDE